ncbi:MFS transporter [Gryllotalpicola koreensis]|uniref:MFS transporter n=1 Tax=Gryllotalpicola koreensis TaxID=993086 RepID=A0ABP7ZQH2_9MICO
MKEKIVLESSPRRWWVLGTLVLSLLVVQLDTTILGMAVQRLSQPAPAGLGLTQGELLWAINSYTLVMAGGLLTAGALADRFGRKRVLLIGMVLFGLTSAWCAFAVNGPMLIAGRTVLGLAAALVTPTTLAIITNTFTPQERPKAIGIWSGGVGVAVAAGPILGGLLLDHLWWGSIFLVNVPVVIIALIAMAVVVPESRNPRPGRFDIPGIVLSLLGMVLLVDGIIEGGDTGDWTSPNVWGVVLAGAIVLAGFLLWERRAADPLLPVGWFRVREFSGSITVMTLAFFAMLGVTFTVTFYLLSLRRLDVLAVGLLMLPLAIAQLVFSSQTPRLAARFGARATGAFGMLALTAALLLFATLDSGTSLWIVEVAMFLIGVGIAFIMPSASAAIMGSVPRERAGTASAASNAFRQIGGALGTAVLGAVLTSTYRTRITGHLDAIPEGLRSTAAASIQATQGMLDSLGLSGAGASAITTASDQAFIAGFHASSLLGAAIALLGAIIAAVALTPKRTGSWPPNVGLRANDSTHRDCP